MENLRPTQRYLGNCFSFLFSLGLFLTPSVLTAQITGNVFRDFNGNGTKDANEPLVQGVTVNAYNAANTLCGTTTSAGSTAPNYSLTGCGTASVRVEFVVPSTGSCTNSGVDYSALSGTTYGSSVQFVNGNSTNVNFALHNPSDYNQGTTNISAFVPCYVNGDPLAGGNSGTMDWYVGFNYTNTGTTTPQKKVDGTIIGSVWGVAFSKQAQKSFAAAFIKRHVGLGQNGSGAIYLMTETATSFTPTLFFDMDNNAFNTASNPATRTRALASAPAYGAGSTFNLDANKVEATFMGSPDPLSGQPEGFGVVGTNAQRGLTGTKTDPSYDPAAFDQVGKVGIGDIDISPDGKFLFVTNLFQKKIFRLELDNAANPTSVIAVTTLSFPTTTCPNGVLRPFALKFERDKLYMGCLCTAENSTSTDGDLSAKVYTYDNPTASATLNTTPVLDIALDYEKGDPGSNASLPASTKFNHKWTAIADVLIPINGTSTSQQMAYPQPVLSDIEFTSNGDMVLGFFDRTGHQWGSFNRQFLGDRGTGNNTLKGIYSSGDILVAGLNCTAGTYALENNGGYTSANGTAYTSGTANTEGPGGSEFFKGDSYNGHNETAQGGLGAIKGQNEVMTISMDPLALNSGGVIRLSTVDGTKVAAYQLYLGVGTSQGLFGKAQGLGDVEFSGIEAPIEIGNRVWTDTNNNGIQDADEAGIDGVTVKLFEGTTEVASTTTANGGQYYFTNANVTGGVKTNTAYEIRIATAQTPLSTLSLATTDVGTNGSDLIDNDGTTSGANAIKAFTTGLAGQNNHGYDFGFKSAPACSLIAPELTVAGSSFGPGTAPNSENVTLNGGTNVLPESNVAGFKFSSSSEGAFYTFCTQISQPILPLQNPYTHELTSTTNGFTTAAALRIAQVVQASGFNSVTGFGAGNNTITNFVALQLAVWNALYDTDYSLTAGSFQSLTENNAGARTLGNSWLTTAQTIANPTVVVHNLYHSTGQDLLMIGDVPPITLILTPPSCSGVGAPNNGDIHISGFTAGQRYQYSTGSTFNAGSAIPASITAIPADSLIVSTLPNTTGSYTVRVYDATDDGCFVDRVVSINAITCITCTAPTITSVAADTATCTNGVANNNAAVHVTGITGMQKYVYGTNGTATLYYANATASTATTIDLTGLANPSVATTYTFRIYASDSTCYNDTTVVLNPSVCPLVGQNINLTLSKTVDSTCVSIAGRQVTFTLKVKNISATNATGVKVKVASGAGFTFVSATPSVSYTSGTGIWTVGAVNAGDSATLQLTVTADSLGVNYCTAEIDTADQTDINSTPNNGVTTEDDIARACVSVPMPLCPNQSYNATLPNGLTGIQWYKDGSPISGETNQVLTITEIGEYTFTANESTCPVQGCCPIKVVTGTCTLPCKPVICLPVAVVRQ